MVIAALRIMAITKIVKVAQFFSKKKETNNNSQLNNKESMKKQLQLDDVTARKLYPTAQPEFKVLLEESFGKEFFSQKVTDRINDYKDILNEWGVDESADEVKIPGFNAEENEFIKNMIKRVRISKVYNEGWFPKRCESRHYPYYDISSGFAFFHSFYDATRANAASAARLCLKNRELAIDMAKKFPDVEKGIILG